MRNLLLALCLVIGIAQVSFAQGNEKSTAKTTSTSVQPSVSVDKAGTTSHPACTENKTASTCCKNAAASGKSCCANKAAATTVGSTESSSSHSNCSHGSASTATERTSNDPK